MTHEEITRISAECDIALREENRRYAVWMGIELEEKAN